MLTFENHYKATVNEGANYLAVVIIEEEFYFVFNSPIKS